MNINLYVQNDTLLLVDVFNKFRNMYLKVYELNPARFFSGAGLEMASSLQKD